MQDSGLSLERSAAAGEEQRELSCQSCMQQAIQYQININKSIYSSYFCNSNMLIVKTVHLL